MRKIASLFLILLSGMVSLGWLLKSTHFFVLDDYSHLLVVAQKTVGELFTILPSQVYNDRPVGQIFIKVLQSFFDKNWQGYHVVFLGVHLLNALMLSALLNCILRDFNFETDELTRLRISTVAAILFVAWPNSTLASWWISAVFDLLGGFFCILIFWLIARAVSNRAYTFTNGLSTCLLFILALRTKEMVLPLPFLILIYLLARDRLNKDRLKSARIIYCTVGLMITLALVYAVILSRLNKGTDSILDETNPYFLSFKLSNLYRSLWRYFVLFFDFKSGGFSYEESPSGLILISLCVLAWSLQFYYFRSKKSEERRLWISGSLFLMGFAALGPVAPMRNMQHMLYLYIPSAFWCAGLGLLLAPVLRSRLSFSVFVMILVAGLYGSSLLPGPALRKEQWLKWGVEDQRTIASASGLLNSADPALSQLISIYGAQGKYSLFSYGPGNGIKYLLGKYDQRFEVINKNCDEAAELNAVGWCLCNDQSLSEIGRGSTSICGAKKAD